MLKRDILFNQSGAKAMIFWDNYTNIMATDDLFTCIAMSSTVKKIMTMQHKWDLLCMGDDLNDWSHLNVEKW